MLQAPSDVTDQSESLGIRALGFLLSQPAEFALFLAHTGLNRGDFGCVPYREGQLSAALEFLMANEAILLRFVRRTGRPPETIYEAWRAIGKASWVKRAPPGGERSWPAIS